MTVTVTELAAWLNKTYPTRNWDQQCARLMWNAVYFVSGVEERDMRSYDPAKDAFRASEIESLAPGNAPVGALHYFANPPIEGHVALDVGGGLVLMTGTRAALGRDAQMLGTGYGLTTVASYMEAKGNPYLGWSRRYGANVSIINQISVTKHTPKPKPKRKQKPMSITTVYAPAKDAQGNSTYDAVSFNVNTGEERTFQSGTPSYIINVGRSYSTDPDTIVSLITRSHYDRIRAENAQTRERLNARAGN